MQTEPTKSIDQEPPTSASTSEQTNIQDGFRSPEPSSLDEGSQTGLPGLSSALVANGASPVLKGGYIAETGAEGPSPDSHEDHYYSLPGGRVAAYEHATTPSIPTGFKVAKRPISPSEGPSLTDCPNGVLLT
jgi:hypothetical protein